MSREDRLESLLARYVEQRMAGRHTPDPVELCRDAPELLEPLRGLIQECESIARRLAAAPDDPRDVRQWLATAAAQAGAAAAAAPDTRRPRFALSPGTVLAHRYRIRALLGRGGQGEVWRAEDLKLHIDVALKSLRSDRVDASALERIRREVTSARDVVSANVCRIFDLVEADGHELVSMECVEGETLADLLDRRAPLELDEATRIAAQLLAGLEAVHAAGFVHRDVKPANVMVTPSGRVVLMDLGLARRVDDQRAGSVSGTPPYMAPEQIRGDSVDARADLYSTALVLAEMLQPASPAGRPASESSPRDSKEGPPRRGTTAWAAALLGLASPSSESSWRALRESPPRLALTPWAPVLRKALAEDPAARFSSAGELARALEEATRRSLEPRERGLRRVLARVAGTAAGWRPGRGGRPTAPQPVRVRAARGHRALAGGALALVLAGYALLRTGSNPSAALPASAAVAVLPLSYATGDSRSEQVGAGIADVLVTALAQVPGVTVISGDSTLEHGERDRDLSAVARELGADLLVYGAVQAAGERFRVTLNLQRPTSKRVEWSRFYDGDLAGIFELQSEVAAAVSQALRQSLTRADRRRLERSPPTEDREALADYVQARSFLDRADVGGNLERSVTLFESAIRKDPRFARAHAGLGEAAWLLFTRTHDASWSQRALDVTTEALRLDPEDAATRRALAVVYDGRGRTEEAIEEFRRAIALDPESDDAHRLLGEALLRKGLRDAGFAELRLAVDLRPSYWRHRQTLARELFRFGDTAAAIVEFRRVTELQPDNPWGFSGLGAALYASADAAGAIEALQKAVALGGDPSAHSNLGTILFAEGRFTEAAAAFEEAARLFPGSPAKHRNLGDAYEKLGERERARQAYARAVELARATVETNPSDALALAQLAVYEAKLGNIRDAARHANEAAELGPHLPDVQYRRAVVLALAGRAEESLVALEEAIERGYNRKLAREDEDLSALHDLPGFERLTDTAAPAEKGVPG